MASSIPLPDTVGSLNLTFLRRSGEAKALLDQVGSSRQAIGLDNCLLKLPRVAAVSGRDSLAKPFNGPVAEKCRE